MNSLCFFQSCVRLSSISEKPAASCIYALKKQRNHKDSNGIPSFLPFPVSQRPFTFRSGSFALSGSPAKYP
jgi:hypothetical protein